MKKYLCVILVLTMSACSLAEPFAPQPTATIIPTMTPTNTPTPIPSPTIVPSFTPTPNLDCPSDQVKTVTGQFQDILNRWNDTDKLAGSTARIALSGPVGELQQIKRDAAKVEVPPCLWLARDYLTKAMDFTIGGYLDFLSQQPDAVVKGEIDQGIDELATYNKEILRIEACVPNCAHSTTTQ